MTSDDQVGRSSYVELRRDTAQRSSQANLEPRTTTWTVDATTQVRYEVAIAEPLTDPSNRMLLTGGNVPGRRLVVFDEGVPNQWQLRLRSYFETHGVAVEIVAIPGGESSKSSATYLEIVGVLDAFAVDRRNEPVIVVGGGAVMDAAGFAASTYRRGVPFLNVPTTLLAWIDASVGIKTAINYGHRKNLIGTFAAPMAVLLERRFLASLPERELASGMGEVLKLGIGCDYRLFALLEDLPEAVVFDQRFQSGGLEILLDAIDVMIRELSSNIFEAELCRAIDLGHTFSQAYEMAGRHDALPHGEAVALDLNISCSIAQRRGLLTEREVNRVTAVTQKLRLCRAIPELDTRELWESLIERTTHRGGRQRVPLPCGLGACVFVNDLTWDELEAARGDVLDHFGL
jgi:3-dehydroquinate synthase